MLVDSSVDSPRSFRSVRSSVSSMRRWGENQHVRAGWTEEAWHDAVEAVREVAEDRDTQFQLLICDEYEMSYFTFERIRADILSGHKAEIPSQTEIDLTNLDVCISNAYGEIESFMDELENIQEDLYGELRRFTRHAPELPRPEQTETNGPSEAKRPDAHRDLRKRWDELRHWLQAELTRWK